MTESQPILVPLDGSDFAEQAIPVASAVAARWDAPLRLARVHVEVASEVHCADGLVVMDDQRDVESRLHDAAYLEQVRALTSEVATETAVLEGPVSAALAEDARARGARLVVMTTHGRSGFQRLWLGSVADALVRRSPVPLLVVRPQEGRSLRQRFRKVLVPLDDSEVARSILSHVARVAEPGARLVLLTVIEPTAWQSRPGDTEPSLPDESEREAAATACLEETADPLREMGFEVSTRVAVSRRCAHEILAAAHGLDVDMIALATHGRSGLARAAMGSVADEVVHGSEVPVLLHRPRLDTPGGTARLR